MEYAEIVEATKRGFDRGETVRTMTPRANGGSEDE